LPIAQEYTFELQIHMIVVSLTARYRKFREMHLKVCQSDTTCIDAECHH